MCVFAMHLIRSKFVQWHCILIRKPSASHADFSAFETFLAYSSVHQEEEGEKKKPAAMTLTWPVLMSMQETHQPSNDDDAFFDLEKNIYNTKKIWFFLYKNSKKWGNLRNHCYSEIWVKLKNVTLLLLSLLL